MVDSNPAIVRRVKEVLIGELGIADEQFHPHASLTNGLGADSLDRINLMMACEEEFGIAIEDDEAERCATVADVVELVTRKVAARMAAETV